MSIRKLLTFGSLAVIVGVLVSGSIAGGVEPSEELRATLLLGSAAILIAVGVSFLVGRPGYSPGRKTRRARPDIGPLSSTDLGVASGAVIIAGLDNDFASGGRDGGGFGGGDGGFGGGFGDGGGGGGE